MDKTSLLEDFLICPGCGSKIRFNGQELSCTNCKKHFSFVENGIADMLDEGEKGDFTMKKWEEFYLDCGKMDSLEKEYKKLYLGKATQQVLEYSSNLQKGRIFLEIGCGNGFLGEELAKQGWLFIGVDFSLNALRGLKKRLESRGVENFMLIHSDIKNLPLKDNSVDLIYGGGVIEHFKDNLPVLKNLHRVLKEKGVAFNTVPLLNIGNFMYRSLWGGIPNLPILKQLAEFIHIRILKGKHMVFGYELMFTEGQLRRMHANAGFTNKIIIDRFDIPVELNAIKNSRIRRFVSGLSRKSRHFWPMVKVIAVK